jgi:UDP-N-acetyl-D-mannosaminuronate dehydrogenase
MASTTNGRVISVIGLGTVGLPTALLLAQAGITVIGVDVQRSLLEALMSFQLPPQQKDPDGLLQELLNDPVVQRNFSVNLEPQTADVFIVAVPTPLKKLPSNQQPLVTCDREADLSMVESAVEALTPKLRPGNLVIIESTVPPKTCREIVAPLLEVSQNILWILESFMSFTFFLNPKISTTLSKIYSLEIWFKSW